MNSNHVTELLQSMSGLASRRRIVASLTGGLMAAGIGGRGLNDADARKKRKRKRKKKRKNKKGKNNPKTRADATCPGLGVSRIFDVGTSRIAQTFTAVRSGQLIRAELLIDKVAGSAGDYFVRLSPVDRSGLPTNEVLAETSVADATVPDGKSTVTFTFGNPVAVEADTEYALVLTRPSGETVAWSGDNDNPCAGGFSFSPDQTTPFDFLSASFDLVFTTFVRS